MGKVYIGLDGDNIGRVIESYLIRNQPENVIAFSQKIVNALEAIKQKVISTGGEVLFCSGDSILFFGEYDLAFCNDILAEFHKSTGKTASIGIGNSTAHTYLGLKLSKSMGGNRSEFYNP